MNLPPGSRDERRAVPRHLRDSEHDNINGEDAQDGGRRMRAWIYAGVLAALLGMSLWFGLGAG